MKYQNLVTRVIYRASKSSGYAQYSHGDKWNDSATVRNIDLTNKTKYEAV